MDSVFPVFELAALIVFVAGLVWLAVEIISRDPHGAVTMLRDSEEFARAPVPPAKDDSFVFGATMPRSRDHDFDLLSDYRPFI